MDTWSLWIGSIQLLCTKIENCVRKNNINEAYATQRMRITTFLPMVYH